MKNENATPTINHDGQLSIPHGGLTLRDYFAAKAMQGLMANPAGPIQSNGSRGWGWCNCSPEDVVNLVYSLADAMISERNK